MFEFMKRRAERQQAIAYWENILGPGCAEPSLIVETKEYPFRRLNLDDGTPEGARLSARLQEEVARLEEPGGYERAVQELADLQKRHRGQVG